MTLIKQHSDPVKLVWVKLPGRPKKMLNSYKEAETYLARKNVSSESEAERLAEVNAFSRKRTFGSSSAELKESGKYKCIIYIYIRTYTCLVNVEMNVT